MNERIVVPAWLKAESPISAGFCEMINEALKSNPNMSLAEFADILHEQNVEASYKRLQAIEARQFGEMVGGR